jgi:ubiquinone/menaquinone biosynthesis C-methylase UbiE
MSDDYWETAYESGEYKHWEFKYPSPELTALVAANALRKEARALDVGSGGGLDAIFLAQHGFNVMGIDVSSSALRIAKKRAKKAHVKVDWVRGSILKLPLKSGKFDLIIDRGLFHLIEDADRPDYASEVFKVLKNGARLLIRGKSPQSAHGQFNPVTKEAIDKYFSDTDFKKGPLLPIPLFSVEGAMDAAIVMLQKRRRK